jgi:hypothetical protein
MVVLGEKLSGLSMDRSTGVLGIVLGDLFLRRNRVRPTLLMASERLPRMRITVESVRVMYMDWRRKHTCRVDRVFPCRVYIDLNRRDSRI